MGEIVKLNEQYKIIMEEVIFNYIVFNNENPTINFFKKYLGIFLNSNIFKKYFKIKKMSFLDDVILNVNIRKRFKIEDFEEQFNKIYSTKFTLNINGIELKIERKESLLIEIINKNFIYLFLTQDLINKYGNLIREYFQINKLITGDTIFEIEDRFILLECDKIKDLDINFRNQLKTEKYKKYGNIHFIKDFL